MSNRKSNPTFGGPHELALYCLGWGERGLSALLEELRPGQETDWIEYKSVLYPGDLGSPHLKTEATRGAFHWHVARGVIAMANACGGALIVGVTDDGHVLGLEASEGYLKCNGDEDRYLRNYVRPVFEPKNGIYDCGKKGRLRLRTPLPETVRIGRVVPFRGKHVLVIVVTPLAQDAPLLGADDLTSEAEFYPFRRMGNQGGVKDLRNLTEINTAMRERGIQRPDIAVLASKVVARLTAAQGTPEPDGKPSATTQAIQPGEANRLQAQLDRILRGLSPIPRELPITTLASWLLLDQPSYYAFLAAQGVLTFEEVAVDRGYPLTAVQNFEKVNLYRAKGHYVPLKLTRAGSLPSRMKEEYRARDAARISTELNPKRFTFEVISSERKPGALCLIHRAFPKTEFSALHAHRPQERFAAGDVAVGGLVLDKSGLRILVRIDRVLPQAAVAAAQHENTKRVVRIASPQPNTSGAIAPDTEEAAGAGEHSTGNTHGMFGKLKTLFKARKQ